MPLILDQAPAPSLRDGGAAAGLAQAGGFLLVGGPRASTGYVFGSDANPTPGTAGVLGGRKPAGLTVEGSLFARASQTEHLLISDWDENNTLALVNMQCDSGDLASGHGGFTALRLLDASFREAAAFGWGSLAGGTDPGNVFVEVSNAISAAGVASYAGSGSGRANGAPPSFTITSTGRHVNPGGSQGSFPRLKVENFGAVSFLRLNTDKDFYPVLAVNQTEGLGATLTMRDADKVSGSTQIVMFRADAPPNSPGLLLGVAAPNAADNTSSYVTAANGALRLQSGALVLSAAGGDAEFTTAGKGILVRSPNGTRYRIAVSDAGALTSTAAP